MPEQTEIGEARQQRNPAPLPPDVTVHLAESNDEPAIVDLFTEVFGHWPRWDAPEGSASFLQWALEAPDPMQGVAAVVRRNEQIVGAALGLRRPAKLKGELRTSAVGLYAAMHPDARGLGIVEPLADTMMGQVEVLTGFSQVETLQRRRRRRGHRSLGNSLSVFVRVLDARRAGDGRESGNSLVTQLGYAALRIRGALRRRRAPRTPLTVRMIDSFDERVDSLWAAASTSFDFILHRTAPYLNWRFCDRRAGEFQALAVEDGDQLVGYAVLRRIGTRGHIADLLVLPDRTDALRAVLDASADLLRADGAAAVECTMMLHHPYVATLRRAGFSRFSSRSEQMVHRLSIGPQTIDREELAFLSNPKARIHIVEGDSDLI